MASVQSRDDQGLPDVRRTKQRRDLKFCKVVLREIDESIVGKGKMKGKRHILKGEILLAGCQEAPTC